MRLVARAFMKLGLEPGQGVTIDTNRERVMNAITAYQLTSMMQGVVQRPSM